MAATTDIEELRFGVSQTTTDRSCALVYTQENYVGI